MIFLFFVRRSCRRSFCLFFRHLCVFSRFVIYQSPFLFGLSYSAASIKISWIPLIGILHFLGFLTTFPLLVGILRYLHSHHFLFDPNIGYDPRQGYLTKKKNFISAQFRTARDIFIFRGYKKWFFLIWKKIGKDL